MEEERAAAGMGSRFLASTQPPFSRGGFGLGLGCRPSLRTLPLSTHSHLAGWWAAAVAAAEASAEVVREAAALVAAAAAEAALHRAV
jgi:hypothetical protein